MSRFRLPTLCLGLLVLFGGEVAAQQLRPLDQDLESSPGIRFFGSGGVVSLDKLTDEVESAEPNAGILVDVRPSKHIDLLMGFNKGAGLQRTSADSFSVRSLLFPETGNTGFSGTLGVPIVFSRSSGDLETRWTVEPFAEVLWQSYKVENLRFDPEAGPDAPPHARMPDLEFTATTWSPGVKLHWTMVSESQGNRGRLTASVAYTVLEIASGDRDEFRVMFDEPVPTRYAGLSARIGLQFNDVAFAVSYKDLESSSGAAVSDLTGGEWNLSTSISGLLWGW